MRLMLLCRSGMYFYRPNLRCMPAAVALDVKPQQKHICFFKLHSNMVPLDDVKSLTLFLCASITFHIIEFVSLR